MNYSIHFLSFNYQAKPTDLLNFACFRGVCHHKEHFFSNIVAIFNIMVYSIHIIGLTPVNCLLSCTCTPVGV